jgi:hypothetical protein
MRTSASGRGFWHVGINTAAGVEIVNATRFTPNLLGIIGTAVKSNKTTKQCRILVVLANFSYNVLPYIYIFAVIDKKVWFSWTTGWLGLFFFGVSFNETM